MKTKGAISFSHIKLGDLRQYLSDEMVIPVQRKWLEKLFQMNNINQGEKPEMSLSSPQKDDKVEPVQLEVVEYK